MKNARIKDMLTLRVRKFYAQTWKTSADGGNLEGT